MERRSLPRFTPNRPLTAKVRAFLPARVLDISLGGMQVELAHSLPPRATCDLRFLLDDEEVLLRGTVRRCQVWGSGEDEAVHKVLIYRAGIEFDEPSRQRLAGLNEAILGPDSPWRGSVDQAATDDGDVGIRMAPEVDEGDGGPGSKKG
jgi:hypothetical protein